MVQWLNYPAKQQVESGDSTYAEVINHCPSYKNFIQPGDKVTSVHEVTHGINADIRNANAAADYVIDYDWGNVEIIGSAIVPRYKPDTHCHIITPIRKIGVPGDPDEPLAGGKNGFYCLKDRAILITEPRCRKKDAIPFIPESLRFSRYSTYVAGQEAWDGMPYYLFDEGVAYANGANCILDMNSRGEYHDSGNDFIFGPVEFLAYLAGVLMAADKNGQLNQDAIEFAHWHFYRVTNIYYLGKTILPWDDMEKCVSILKDGSEAQAIRDFLKNKINFVFPEGPVNPDDPAKPLKPDDFYLGG